MTKSAVQQLVDDITRDGKLSGEEKKRLDALLVADGQLSPEECKQLDRILHMIANGELAVEC